MLCSPGPLEQQQHPYGSVNDSLHKACTLRASVGGCAPYWNPGGGSDDLWITLQAILPFSWRIAQVQNGMASSSYLVESKKSNSLPPCHHIPFLFSSDWQFSGWGGWLSPWSTYILTTLSNVSWVTPILLPSEHTFSTFALLRAEISPNLYVLASFCLRIPS